MTTYRRTHSSRRVFLKQSGAVLAGLPLVSSGAIAVNTAPQKIHIGIVEALAYTVPGIVAHESALRGGEQLKIPQWV